MTGQYGAGRCQHGDFQYTFDNATQDKNYDVITDLSNKLANYESKLVKIYGDMSVASGIASVKSQTSDNAVYDLTGKKLSTLKSNNVYIKNGKKYFNK